MAPPLPAHVSPSGKSKYRRWFNQWLGCILSLTTGREGMRCCQQWTFLNNSSNAFDCGCCRVSALVSKSSNHVSALRVLAVINLSIPGNLNHAHVRQHCSGCFYTAFMDQFMNSFQMHNVFIIIKSVNELLNFASLLRNYVLLLARGEESNQIAMGNAIAIILAQSL